MVAFCSLAAAERVCTPVGVIVVTSEALNVRGAPDVSPVGVVLGLDFFLDPADKWEECEAQEFASKSFEAVKEEGDNSGCVGSIPCEGLPPRDLHSSLGLL